MGVLLLLVACSAAPVEIHHTEPLANGSETAIQRTSESAFSQLCSQLPKILLPYKTSCGTCCERLSREFPEIQPYLPEGAQFQGVLNITDNYVALLLSYPADERLPAIATYTPQGKPLDERILMKSLCGTDPGFRRTNDVSISNDLQIRERDTVFTFGPGYADTAISESRYMILENGQITR